MSGRPSTMDTFMDAVKAAAERAGNAASLAGQRAKLRTEILLADRNVTLRKRAFGAEMYDHVAPLTDTQDFYASNDTLMETLRPPLLSAHREILALNGRRGKLKEAVNAKQVERTGAFPVPATTWSGKVWNAGKATGLAGAEAKLRTDLAAVERQILGIKEDFGEELYGILVDLEEKSGWLPTDRDVRAIYDQCRRDIDNLEKGKKEKMQQLVDLGGTVENYNAPTLDTSIGGSQQQQQRPIDAVQDKPLPVSTGGGAGPPSVFHGQQQPQQQQQQGFGAQTVGAQQQQPAAPDPSLDVFGVAQQPPQIQPQTQRQDSSSSSQGFGGGASNAGAPPYGSQQQQQGGFQNGGGYGGYGNPTMPQQQNAASAGQGQVVDQQQQGWNTIFGVSSGAGNANGGGGGGGGSFSAGSASGGGGGGGFGISQQRALNALAGSSTARSVAAAGVSQMAKSAVAGNGFGGAGGSGGGGSRQGSSSNNAGGNNPPRDLLWD